MNRRETLKCLAALAGASTLVHVPGIQAIPQAPNATGDLRITEVKYYRLEAELSQRFGWSLGWTNTRNANIFEVRTNQGIVGWGEGGWRGDIADVNDWLRGKNPFQLEVINAALTRMEGNGLASGIDNALWDVIGQALGEPIWALLGTKQRDSIKCYVTGLYRKDWPDFATGLQEEAASYVQRGFKAMKMKIGYGSPLDEHIVSAVREAIGPYIKLGADANTAYNAGTAVAVARRLEPYNLMFLEEPVIWNNFDAWKRLKQSVAVPLASGEGGSYEDKARHLITNHAVDIVQPDISSVGGLTCARKTNTLAQAHNILVNPHCWGTEVRIATTLHWIAVIPKATRALAGPEPLLEYDQTENPTRGEILKQPLVAENGEIALPTKPGLGVTVNRKTLEKLSIG
jgi:D-galactarolactone cycloisomerase